MIGALWIAVELTERVVPWQGGCEGLSKIWTEDLGGERGVGWRCAGLGLWDGVREVW